MRTVRAEHAGPGDRGGTAGEITAGELHQSVCHLALLPIVLSCVNACCSYQIGQDRI